jgi:hypothetical protein
MIIKPGTGFVARNLDVRNGYKILTGESEGPRLITRARFNPGNNIKISIL